MARCETCMTNPVHPDKKCCFNCARVGENCEVWHNCGEDCHGWESNVKTNADRIRAMSDRELAEIIMCPYDFEMEICSKKDACIDCCMDWLKQPAED